MFRLALRRDAISVVLAIDPCDSYGWSFIFLRTYRGASLYAAEKRQNKLRSSVN